MKISYIHPTQYLTIKQVKTLFHASEKAFELGCPLNRFITIHIDDFVDKKRPQKFVINFLDHTRRWLQRRGIRTAYLYVLENSPIKGIHVHLLLHVPSGYQVKYKKAMAKWVTFPIKRPHIVFKPIQYPI